MAIGVAILVALLAGACATERTLDGARLESEILEQMSDMVGGVRSVNCPDTPDPAPGMDVLCVASLDAGQVIDVDVRLGGTAEELTSTASVDTRFVAVNEVAALLAGTFGDEVGLATSVDCGRAVLVLEEDEPVLCRATDPSGVTREFDVFIDDAGVVDFRLR